MDYWGWGGEMPLHVQTCRHSQFILHYRYLCSIKMLVWWYFANVPLQKSGALNHLPFFSLTSFLSAGLMKRLQSLVLLWLSRALFTPGYGGGRRIAVLITQNDSSHGVTRHKYRAGKNMSNKQYHYTCWSVDCSSEFLYAPPPQLIKNVEALWELWA